ncbi:hypothetical protein B0T26DRAFT_46891 [Lasiosphaeria miniovina]|uniref:Uncharacterized protein n=1 Tax=Lasiosphaeria miniovina TaxID=1954250 RepID=A0AA40BGU0_9PEZI|nr:uncharacterized protein B0T26DRAFT_46891 [Lasiosphaeria miniovina]KAK0733982.1 hypothetical protein B0T26DRAFT_46891 [Lasiosphaeria miniovina]
MRSVAPSLGYHSPRRACRHVCHAMLARHSDNSRPKDSCFLGQNVAESDSRRHYSSLAVICHIQASLSWSGSRFLSGLFTQHDPGLKPSQTGLTASYPESSRLCYPRLCHEPTPHPSPKQQQQQHGTHAMHVSINSKCRPRICNSSPSSNDFVSITVFGVYPPWVGRPETLADGGDQCQVSGRVSGSRGLDHPMAGATTVLLVINNSCSVCSLPLGYVLCNTSRGFVMTKCSVSFLCRLDRSAPFFLREHSCHGCLQNSRGD